tara:strand:+ start:60 stop:278 length:219 start_codon:yes stop_codon:yes gene_type:complete
MKNDRVLLGYTAKGKLEEVRVSSYDIYHSHMIYMAEQNPSVVRIEELIVDHGGTTRYWSTHRVEDLISNKDN